MKIKAISLLFLVSILLTACEQLNPTAPTFAEGHGNSWSSPILNTKEALNDLTDNGLPKRINGVELLTIRGWLANTYPWDYNPQHSTVHPVPILWTPHQTQTPFQVMEQNRQLEEYGSGADILEFNVAPGNPDYNHWLRTYLTTGSRPFFVLYEHIHGNSNYTNVNGSKNMDLIQNRKAFTDDIGFFVKNVILPFQSRYVTHNGKAVIYMWSSTQMEGDFASLLEEVKNNYPVTFFGSGELGYRNSRGNNLARIKALDGFIEYSLGGRSSSYLHAIRGYRNDSYAWRQYLRKLESETGKRFIFIPTFQAAYDDSNYPGRATPIMYPRTREEIELHAEIIRSDLNTIYDGIGPFVVYSELPEGAAVIESQCLPESMNRPGRYTGCGTGRLEVLKKYFGK